MEKKRDYVLYVDDSDDDVIMAKRAFKKSRLFTEIITLSDGQECIDYLFSEGDWAGKDNSLPLVLLLDLNMPRIDGFEVLEKLRSSKSTASLPVVVLTTSDARDDIEKAYQLGANSFITKPLKTEDFFRTVIDIGIYWSIHNKI